MSSDRLERKRRSDINDSDDNTDEQPPVKARKSELSSSISKILTETCKNFFNWIAPKFLKNYMIVDNQASHNMGIADGATNNCVDTDDDEEIEVLTVQNGTAGVRSKMFSDLRMPIAPLSARPPNATICPLASTPHSFPLNSPMSRISRTLERRKTNGFRFEDKSRHRARSEKCGAPITNPSCEIELLLKGESLKNKEIEIVAEIKPQKHSSASSRRIKSFNEYLSSKEDKANYAEDLIGSTSSRSLSSSKSFTACEVVRLQERAQYKLLLDKVVKRSRYLPGVPPRDSPKSPIQIDLTDDDDRPDLSFHFKKDEVEPVDNFMSKYFKPCALVPHAANNEPQNHKEQDSEDEVQIIDEMPGLKPYVPSTTIDALFSEDWIKELKMTILSETEKRLQLIAETEEKVQRFKKRRDAKVADQNRIKDEMRLAGVILPEDVAMEEDVLPEITPEMEAVIARALGPGHPNEQLVSFDRLTLSRNDISTLSKLNWLNDQVINFYLALIGERSKLDNYPSVHVFNSFFYSSVKTRGPTNVLRWTRRIDIFSFDLIVVPLHLEMHWALLVVDNRSKKIKYYDSMGSGEDKCLLIMQNYLAVEMQDKKKIPMDPNMYSLEIAKDIPKQMNGSDCGMFTLKYAEYLSRDAPLTFTQEHMPYFRRRMVYELLTKQIL